MYRYSNTAITRATIKGREVASFTTAAFCSFHKYQMVYEATTVRVVASLYISLNSSSTSLENQCRGRGELGTMK
jgi:hypothetical protein